MENGKEKQMEWMKKANRCGKGNHEPSGAQLGKSGSCAEMGWIVWGDARVDLDEQGKTSVCSEFCSTGNGMLAAFEPRLFSKRTSRRNWSDGIRVEVPPRNLRQETSQNPHRRRESTPHEPSAARNLPDKERETVKPSATGVRLRSTC